MRRFILAILVVLLGLSSFLFRNEIKLSWLNWVNKGASKVNTGTVKSWDVQSKILKVKLDGIDQDSEVVIDLATTKLITRENYDDGSIERTLQWIL